jgi:HSP20 family protein
MTKDAVEKLHEVEDRLRTTLADIWPEDISSKFPDWSDIRSISIIPKKRLPNTDIIEDDGQVRIIAELPGIKKEDIDVQIRDHYLQIAAKSESEEQDEAYLRRERQSRQFYRRIKLPTTVDPEKAKATFENGILELELPKVEDANIHRLKIN